MQNVFCHVFKCFCFFISLQNRADKKRLNIIIVAEGAIDCHNKAVTPDYIKDVSTWRSLVKSWTHKLSFRSMDFIFPSWFPSAWEHTPQVLCSVCHCYFDFSHFCMFHASDFLYFFTKIPTPYILQAFRYVLFHSHAMSLCTLILTSASSPLHADYLALATMTGDVLHDFSLCFISVALAWFLFTSAFS